MKQPKQKTAAECKEACTELTVYFKRNINTMKTKEPSQIFRESFSTIKSKGFSDIQTSQIVLRAIQNFARSLK